MEDALQRIIRKLELNENMVSTIIGGIVLLIVAFLFFTYFSQNKETTPTPKDSSIQTQESEATIGQTSSAATSKYTVKSNETLWSIAQDNYDDGYKWVEIAQANNLENPNLLVEGQELDIPRESDITDQSEITQEVVTSTRDELGQETTKALQTEYTVQPGDYLWKIAQEVYNDGYRWTDIWKANQDQLSNPDIIPQGTLLIIPT